MKKAVFKAAIAAIILFFVSCEKQQEESFSSNTEVFTEIPGETVYVEVLIPGEDKIIYVPYEVEKIIIEGREKIPAGKPKLTHEVNCETNTIHFRMEVTFTDPENFPAETKEFSHQMRRSAWGEDQKDVVVCGLKIDPKESSLTTTTSYPEVIDENILSVMVNKKFFQKFSEKVTSSVSGEEEHIWIVEYGYIFGPFAIEQEFSFVDHTVSSTPTTEKGDKDVYPATFNFLVEATGGCSETITNEINLLKKKAPVVVVREEYRNYWFELEKQNSGKGTKCVTIPTNFFPSYYDSYFDVWAIYSDGTEEFVRKESARGSLKWTIAKNETIYVNQSQFNGVQIVDPTFPANGISVGTNLKKLTSTVVVGSVPKEFLAYPTFSWKKINNSIQSQNSTTKKNNAEVEATCSNGKTFNNATTVTIKTGGC